MAYSRLLQYIDSLSDEEKEKYKSLIDEALDRDKLLDEAFAKARRNAELFEVHMTRIQETTKEIHAGISRLNETLTGAAECAKKTYRIIPFGEMGGGGSALRH